MNGGRIPLPRTSATNEHAGPRYLHYRCDEDQEVREGEQNVLRLRCYTGVDGGHVLILRQDFHTEKVISNLPC